MKSLRIAGRDGLASENRGKHVSNPSPRITLNTGIIEWLLKSWVLKER